MGFIFGDLIVETILTEGLADFRANIDDRLDMFYDQLKESYLSTEYGQAELDRFKQYINDNEISIVHNWNIVSQRVPCIFIQNVSSQEQVQRTFINDFSGNIDTIGAGVITDRREEFSFPFNEQVQVGIHVNDPGGPTALRWLYAMVVYFLISRKDDLVDRGLELSTFSATDFNRLNEFLPENIFSRYITFNFINYVSIKDITPSTIITDIDLHGGNNASAPGEVQGGIKVESGRDPETEDSSFYTIDET